MIDREVILGLTGSEDWRGKGDWFPGGRGVSRRKGRGKRCESGVGAQGR